MENMNNYINFLIKYFEKKGFYILLILICLLIFLVFKDFIFLNKLYLFKDTGSDSINDNYPTDVFYSYYIHNISVIPKWSFNQGMGQDIMPFSYADPFNTILFFFSKEYIAYMYGFVELIKIIFAGSFFYLFLKKISLSTYTAVIGGILYSFSGFIIVGSCWQLFSTEAVYLAFLLFSFELLFQNNKWGLFPIVIALIAILTPFDLYLFGLFLFTYFLFRFFEDEKNKTKDFFIVLFKMIYLGLLGIAISSFFFTSEIIQMLESPRVSGDASLFHKLMSKPVLGFEKEEHYVAAIMRFFSNDILGTGGEVPNNLGLFGYRGWSNYMDAPLFYCGLINLILFSQIFQFLNKRKKIIYSILFIVFIFPVIFPYFRYAFWLFAGGYYRMLSFYIAFIVLLYSLKTLNYIDKKNKVNIITLFITLIILLIILYYHYYHFENILVIPRKFHDIIAGFLILYAVLIFLLKFDKLKNIIKILIFLTVFAELFYFSNITVNYRNVITGSENKQKIWYNDHTNDVVDYLNSKDKNFYRVAKEYSSLCFPGINPNITSFNAAKVQIFKGTSSYHCFNQKYYVKFLQELNIIHFGVEYETREISGLSEEPLLHGFVNIKYAFTKSRRSILRNYGYDSLTTIGDVEILKNKYYLPFGFTYDHFINYKDFHKLSVKNKNILLYKACVIDDDIINKNNNFLTGYDLKDTSENNTWDNHIKNIDICKKDTFAFTYYNENLIKGTIKLNEKKMLFFTIPFDKGWSAVVDGRTVQPLLVNIGFTGLLLDRGKHNIVLSFTPQYFYVSAAVSIIAIIIYIFVVFLFFLKRFKKTRFNSHEVS